MKMKSNVIRFVCLLLVIATVFPLAACGKKKTESYDGEALMQSLGSMYVGRDGSVLVLLHEDGHWDGDTGLMLTAPASTREEAVALANEMAQKLSPDWLGANPFE